MKVIILIFSIFTWTHSWSSEPITLKGVTEKVSKNNYKVLEQAQKLYQAKKKISLMRANLLPRLNLWKLLNIPTIIMNPWMAANIATDIAPFLVPSNWFNVRKSKWNYKASREQYRALWANELQHARGLFYSLSRDKYLLQLVEQILTEYEFILAFAENRNAMGVDAPYILDFVNSKYLKVKEDKRTLADLIYEEEKILLFHLGIKVDEKTEIKPVTFPDISSIHPVNSELILEKSLIASPELKQFKFLLASLKKAKSSIYFSILGTSHFSRMAGNGVYDDIPVQNGLGFGMGPSIKISKSKEKHLSIRKKATLETVKLQSLTATKKFNSSIDGYANAQAQRASAERAYKLMIDSMSLGDITPPDKMIAVLNNSFSAQIFFLGYQFDFLRELDTLKRLTFTPPFSLRSSELDDVLRRAK